MINICPIKDSEGNLDEEALSHLVNIAGNIVEGGIKKYSEWKQAMEAKVPEMLNEGDMRTIWENLKADAERKTGQRQSLSVDDAFFKSMRARLGSTRKSADWVNALVGPNGDTTILNKILTETPLDVREAKIVSDATKALKIPRKPGAKATKGPMGIVQKAIDDAVMDKAASETELDADRPGEYKLNEPSQGEPPPSGYLLFDKQMANVLGGQDKADLFSSNVPQDIYEKMVDHGISSLTGKEAQIVSKAMAKVMEPPKKAKPTKFATDIKGIAKEARAQLNRHEAEKKLETHQTAKDWVLDQLQAQAPERRMDEVHKALAAVPDGDNRALAEVFNRFADRGTFGGTTWRLGLQGNMLNNPASLSVALGNHLLSFGVEQTLTKLIAKGMAPYLHASVDMNTLGRAIRLGLTKGVPEGAEIFAHGPNAMTLDNRNDLHTPGSELHQEFTVGNGGKVAGGINAVGRLGGRMHSAAWHAVGIGVQEVALQDAAHYAAIDEMKAAGEKWTPEQIRTRAAELHDDPTQAVLDEAEKQRQEQMFQNPNAFGNWLKGTNPGAKGGIARVARNAIAPIVPFATVASNIVGRGIEHTPGGLPAAVSVLNEITGYAHDNKLSISAKTLVPDIKAVLDHMPSAQRAHLAKILARGVVGTGVGALGYAGYKKGIVNPPNPQRGEYGSINGPFGKKWEVGRALGAYAPPLFLGADLARAQESHDAGVEYNPGLWAQNIGEASAENPMANTGQAYQEMFGGDTPKAGKASPVAKFAASYLTAGMPSFLTNLAGMTDNGTSSPSFKAANGQWAFDPAHMARDKNTEDMAQYIVNSIKSKVPYWRQTLPTSGHEDSSTLLLEPRHETEPTPAELAASRAGDLKHAMQYAHPRPKHKV